jgi:hypothetical protein
LKDFKKLKTFGNKVEAQIAKGFLESHGIIAYIMADDAASMYPSQDFVSGVYLLVKSGDFLKAREILDTLVPEEQTE